LGVFARLEGQLVYVHRQHVEEVVAQDSREELENELGVHFGVCMAVSLLSRSPFLRNPDLWLRKTRGNRTRRALKPHFHLLQVPRKLLF
jgi:hypothetical protein